MIGLAIGGDRVYALKWLYLHTHFLLSYFGKNRLPFIMFISNSLIARVVTPVMPLCVDQSYYRFSVNFLRILPFSKKL
jgi:hypothetical protein